MLKRLKHHHSVLATMFLTSLFVVGLAILAGYAYASYEHRRENRHVDAAARPSAKPPVRRLTPVVPDVRIPPIADGLVPVVSSLPTKERVVFLGIDDGAHKTADELGLMKAHDIKASLFLSRTFIASNPDFFKSFTAAGSVIENHTLSHDITMVRMSYDQMKQEICGMADYEQQQYGRRPVLFRPPGGTYNTEMRRAAADCGMKALVNWTAKANGGSMQYQIGNRLQPGDVVLMHFRPEFQQDMRAFIDAMKDANLHTELLENWLPES